MRLIGLAVVFLVSVALAPPTEAQQPAKIPRLGYLVLAPLSETPSPERAAFLDGLRELGWIEGKTVAVEYRSAKWHVELLDDLAEELVRMKVDIIVAAGPDTLIRAAKQATATIPIVMLGSSDPVGEQFVASLARPGGNVTGISLMVPELGSKRLELLKEVVPRVARLAVLWSPDSWAGIGHVAVGMHRQGYDLQLTQYDDRGWRATFYTTGMEHSPTSATGTGWERTPWHATQRAAWEALKKAHRSCEAFEA